MIDRNNNKFLNNKLSYNGIEQLLKLSQNIKLQNNNITEYNAIDKDKYI